jgi:hypothetical protein
VYAVFFSNDGPMLFSNIFIREAAYMTKTFTGFGEVCWSLDIENALFIGIERITSKVNDAERLV